MTKTGTKRGRKTPCVSYIRVSGDGQIAGDGPTRQRLANETYANTNGLRIDFEASDMGVSGVCDMENRDELPLLLDYVEQYKIKVCLVENASRVSRKLMVGEIILEEFKKHGCTVIESTSGVELTGDDSDETKTLVRQVLSCIAEFQKKVEVKKLAGARKRIRRRTGKCEGAKSLKATPEGWVIYRYIQQLRRKPKATGVKSTKGMTYAAIAKALNEQRIKTMGGKKWTSSNVAKVLTREVIDSDDNYHTQEEIDLAFHRIMPFSPKQMSLISAGDLDHGINDDDVEITLAAYWEDQEGTGKRRIVGASKDKKPIFGEWSDEELSRGRKLWRAIGIKGFKAPAKPKNIINI
jgi:DNA invertase Pin-like site-specific DNA recombinase